MRDFQLIAVHTHAMVLRLCGEGQLAVSLSPREIECLHWVAEGKTAWECSVILGLSVHTVRCYLESARHKLGASGNTHAVAKAIKADLLSSIP
jgi:DNA-binding CsgD family transcriptional regulator